MLFYILNHVLCTEIHSYVECENVFKMALNVCFGEINLSLVNYIYHYTH